MKKMTNKAVVSLLMLGSIVMGLTACGGQKEDAADTTSTGGNTLATVADAGVTHVTELTIENYVSVSDYQNLDITLEGDYSVDEDYLDQIVSYVFSTFATYVDSDKFITDRAVEDGDMINLDYAGYKDGVQFDGGTATNQGLWIGSDSFIDGFEDGLIGVMPGETVDLNLTFPEGYQSEELAGAEVVFTCTVNGIIKEEDIFTAFNEEMMGGEVVANNMEELREYYRDYLLSESSDSYYEELESAIRDALLAKATFTEEFPASIITYYQEQAQSVLETYAGYYGYDVETFANAMIGMTANDYIYNQSYEQLKIDAIFQYIAVKENLMMDDATLDTRIRELFLSYGYYEEELDEQMASVELEEYRMYFVESDVLDYLVKNVKVTPDLR